MYLIICGIFRPAKELFSELDCMAYGRCKSIEEIHVNSFDLISFLLVRELTSEITLILKKIRFGREDTLKTIDS